MPRGRQPQPYQGPSDDDLAEFMAALGPLDQLAPPFDLSGGSLAKLLEEVTHKGYACRLAPYASGRGRSLTVYVTDTLKPVAEGTDEEAFEAAVQKLRLAVRKLPPKRA